MEIMEILPAEYCKNGKVVKMTLYNTKHTELVWRGITLSGFASDKINIEQGAEPSNLMYIGISGETINCPNPKRTWIIKSTFLADSLSYKILEQDNLNHIEDFLLVRDLNIGEVDLFPNCTIINVGSRADGKHRTVIWCSSKRNYK